MQYLTVKKWKTMIMTTIMMMTMTEICRVILAVFALEVPVLRGGGVKENEKI